MYKKRLYQLLASSIQARLNCIAANNTEWIVKHEDTIHMLENYLPHGSGFDTGSKIDLDKSTGSKLIINTEYHHMNENGFYDGWTSHIVKVVPTFEGIDIYITGKDRNDWKEYAYDVFYFSLCEEYDLRELMIDNGLL